MAQEYLAGVGTNVWKRATQRLMWSGPSGLASVRLNIVSLLGIMIFVLGLFT